MNWFLYLFLLISSSVNALTVDIEQKIENVDFVNVLFLTATFGDYKCLDDLIGKSKFLEFLKIKSIDVNVDGIHGSYNLDAREFTIKNKIEKGNFNFIIIIDESKMYSSAFYETLKKTYPNKIITIGHSADSDIILFIDFNRFFLLLIESNSFDSYEIYYLHNKDNPIDELYYNLLISHENDRFSLYNSQLMYVSDLTILIDKIKSKPNVVFISNLDVLYDDVSGKTINQQEIINLLNNYQILTLNISHNSCNYKSINSAFYLLWDYNELINIIDNTIIQRKSEKKSSTYVLSSKFNINLSLNNNILKSPDVKKLKSLLEFTDDVIIKK